MARILYRFVNNKTGEKYLINASSAGQGYMHLAQADYSYCVISALEASRMILEDGIKPQRAGSKGAQRDVEDLKTDPLLPPAADPQIDPDKAQSVLADMNSMDGQSA